MRKLILLFSLAAFIGLSGFESSPPSNVDVKKEISIKIAPNQDVFTKVAQEMIVSVINKATTTSSENPCSGSCVCENWVQYGQVWYRRCGCYWGGDFWFEKKECGYCPGVPSWGSDCQNG